METKIALVTGSSRGLGKNSALRLAEKGYDVIVTYHTKKEEALKVVSEIESMGRKAVALQLNVGDLSAFNSFIEQVSHILREKWNREKFDFLINNAGTGATIPFTQVTEADFDNLMNLHFKVFTSLLRNVYLY